MKIGILTFPHSPSYGASLQMHALFKTIESFNYNPYILNYQNIYMLKKQHMERNVFKAKLMNIIGYNTAKKFKKFENKLNWIPKNIIYEAKELKSISNELDYIIVGSDQVWNPKVNGDDTSYFLDFCKSKQKISYAASFGVNNLEKKHESKIAKLLSDIPSLSTREEQGKNIIKNLTGRDATVVLDPTFLQSKEYWETIAHKKRLVKEPYILSFIFNPNNENEAFCSRLSKETGHPIVKISDNPFKKNKKNLKYVSGIGPQEFLRLIMDAEYIVTDSFHGTAFSIILNRSFYVSLSTKTNSRLEHLLNTLNLEKRIISNCNSLDNCINFTKVNKSISLLRDESLIFLKKSLSEVKNDK